MDTMIERKPGMKRKHYYAVAGAVVLVGLVFYFIFRDTSSSISVEKDRLTDRKSTRLNSSHSGESRMPSSA